MPRKKTKKSALVISKHVLLPKHIKLSDKEKKELLSNYRITIKELPKILDTDSALAGLDAKPGDVIKIIRKSPTSGETIFYRGVSDV